MKSKGGNNKLSITQYLRQNKSSESKLNHHHQNGDFLAKVLLQRAVKWQRTVWQIVVLALLLVMASGLATAQKQNPSQNQTKQSKPMAEIITEKANLRESPDSSSAIIREVVMGEKLTMSDKHPIGAWYKVVDVDIGSEGWLHGNTIKIVKVRKSQPNKK